MNTAVTRTQFPKDVAAALGISVDTVGKYARDGLIPFAKTPKGHRRYNVDEVRAVLAMALSSEPRYLAAGNASQKRRLLPGPPVSISTQSRLREDLRATRTVRPGDDGPNHLLELRSPDSVFDEMLGHARRVLIATGK